MKKTIILGLCIIGIATNSVIAFADSDTSKYPATNFQPKIIFIDKDATKIPPQKAEFDPKYPGTNFQPKVLYTDKSTATSDK
jgi:hypothetical protein